MKKETTKSEITTIASFVNCARRLVIETTQYLGIEKYAFGGSIAMQMHGIRLNRYPHDVDVIVPKGTIENIKEKLKKSFFFIEVLSSSNYDNESTFKHLAIRCINGLDIDFIENDEVIECEDNIMPIKNIIITKLKYNRAKDREDLVLLCKKYFE